MAAQSAASQFLASQQNALQRLVGAFHSTAAAASSFNWWPLLTPILYGLIGGATLIYFSDSLGFTDGDPWAEDEKGKGKKGKNKNKNKRKNTKKNRGKDKGKKQEEDEEEAQDEVEESLAAAAEIEAKAVAEAKAKGHAEEEAQKERFAKKLGIDREKFTKLVNQMGDAETNKRIAQGIKLCDYMIPVFLIALLLYFLSVDYGITAGHWWFLVEYYLPREAAVVNAFLGRPTMVTDEAIAQLKRDMAAHQAAAKEAMAHNHLTAAAAAGNGAGAAAAMAGAAAGGGAAI